MTKASASRSIARSQQGHSLGSPHNLQRRIALSSQKETLLSKQLCCFTMQGPSPQAEGPSQTSISLDGVVAGRRRGQRTRRTIRA